MLNVTTVKWLGGYELRVEFNDGSARQVDLKEELWGEVFEPLQDVELFAQVQVNPETGTIEWPGGADFAPEFLRERGKEVVQAASGRVRYTLLNLGTALSL